MARAAIADADDAGAVGEAAHCRYDLARVRLAAGNDLRGRASSSRWPSSSSSGFGYRPLFAAPLRRLAGRLGSPRVRAPASRVILVTDLVDSTPLTQRVGNQRFLELLREHNRIVRTRLRQFDGVEFKHTGDGVAAWFFNAETAVRCALAIHDAVDRFNDRRREPVHVRIGVAAGDVIANGATCSGSPWSRPSGSATTHATDTCSCPMPWPRTRRRGARVRTGRRREPEGIREPTTAACRNRVPRLTDRGWRHGAGSVSMLRAPGR